MSKKLAKNLEIWSEDILIPTIDILNSLDRLSDKALLDFMQELVYGRSDNFCKKLGKILKDTFE